MWQPQVGDNLVLIRGWDVVTVGMLGVVVSRSEGVNEFKVMFPSIGRSYMCRDVDADRYFKPFVEEAKSKPKVDFTAITRGVIGR